MSKKRVFLPLLLGLFLIISGLSIISPNFLYAKPDNSMNQEIIAPKSSYKVGAPLELDDININKPSIYQYFESINITVNVTKFEGGVNYTYVELTDLNQNHERYIMTYIGNYLFTINYNTSRNVLSQLLGSIKVTFSVYNITGDLLNAGTTSKDFTIKPNIAAVFTPDILIYHKNDNVSVTLTDAYDSRTLYAWNKWNVSIDRDLILDNENELFSYPGYNQSEIEFSINSTFDELDKDYFLHVNLINDTNEIFTTSFYVFKVENTNPKVINSTVSLSSNSIFRSDEDNCHIQLNVTDLETTNPSFINVSMILEHSIDDYIDFEYELFDNNGDGTFQYDFYVDYAEPIGNYNIKLTIKDSDEGTTEYIHSTPLEVKNNAPEIHGYKINGISITKGISIYYSKSITFTFNVSDVDGEVTDIMIVLISSNNQRIERKVGSDSKIYFSSYELVTGVWYVYVYIEDSDGSVVSLTDDYDLAPQAITIIPDVLSAVLPWIALVIGLIIGVLIGVGVGYYWIKTKTSDGQDVSGKKKSVSQKGTLPKRQKGGETSKTKISDSEAKKISDKGEEDKIESDKGTPQRKIKRKL